MNSIYKLMLNNKAFNDIVENLINKKNVAIIKKSDRLNNLIKYFGDFIINEFDKKVLCEIISNIEQEDNYRDLDIKKMTVLRRQINNNTENIIKTFSAFIKKDETNYSLNDLYSITNKSIEFKDKEFEYYSILSKSKLVVEGDSLNITEEANYLIENKYINYFIKYKKFKNNKKFKIIKSDINNDDIDNVISKLGGILNNTFAFIPPIYFNEYTNDFQEEKVYYENYSDDDIKELVKNINYKHNKEILNQAEDFKWYKCIGIKKYKEMLIKKRRLYEEYNEKEKIIYNQYIENIENLNMFSKSFSFINSVYEDKVLYEINNRISNEEELYNYIKYIKETLSIYKDYLEVEDKVEMLSETSKELLNYLYEKLSDKNDLNNILEFIPNYYYYRKIENMENDESDAINSYNKVYEKIAILNEALKSYDKILLKVIRKKCNEAANMFIKEANMKLDKLDIDKLINERYTKENIEFLLKIFPMVILDEKQYIENKEKIDELFSFIINESDLVDISDNKEIECDEVCKENLDRSIFKMLNNLGYTIFQKEDDISIIYVDFGKAENKVIYINNKEFFDCKELIKIIDLMNSGCKVIFVWYRNWWMNKSEEVQKIHKLLNE